MRKAFNLLTDEDYDALNAKLDRIIEMLEHKGSSSPIKKWLSEKETQDLLGKKATTLWKMRNKGLLEFTKINNKVFYSKESIDRLMEHNKKDAYAIKSNK